MRITLVLALLIAHCATFASTPINGWYASIFGGYTGLPNNISKTIYNQTFQNGNYQPGFDAGGNIGYKANPLRYEGEITYLKANANGFQVNQIRQSGITGYSNAILAMANVYYDFPGIIDCLEPFLGVGIGYAGIQTKLNSTGPLLANQFSAAASAFAYQATGGITYNFADNYALNLGYRYVATTNAFKFGSRFQANIANLGATYRFDGNNYK